jgi:heterodisulfide reductase subunit C
MDYVQAAIRGDIEDVAKLSFECIECGLCAMRCPAEISPHYVARLSRRLYSKYISRSSNPLAKRVREIEEGEFDAELERYTKMDVEELKKLYVELQGDKR